MALTKVIGDGLGTLTDKVEIDATDDLRLRFLNGSSFKAGIQVPTSTGDMITNSAVNDLAIRSQTNMLFATGGSTEHMRIDSIGAVTKPLQPAFLALSLASELTDLSTGTDHTIVFSSERFDQNSDYNTSNGEFTAPVTGKYQFNFMLYTNHVDTGATYYQVKLLTSNQTYVYIIEPKFSSDVLYFTWHAPHLLVDMDASDTAKVQIKQTGGTAQLHVSNNGSYTNFSGHLVC